MLMIFVFVDGIPMCCCFLFCLYFVVHPSLLSEASFVFFFPIGLVFSSIALSEGLLLSFMLIVAKFVDEIASVDQVQLRLSLSYGSLLTFVLMVIEFVIGIALCYCFLFGFIFI